MHRLSFRKMQGLSNDFVVIDLRAHRDSLNAEQVRLLADRRRGVGCDQLILIEQPQNAPSADVFMRIYNSDGSQVDACGNATRCVGDLVLREKDTTTAAIETNAGLLHVTRAEDGLVCVDMGPPGLGWRDIPLSQDCDTLALPISCPPLGKPVAVSMGNPHAVFFVPDVQDIDLHRFGAELEHHPLFPERANINVASLTAPDRLRLRVFERGAGITPACGTGACATAVAAVRRGLCGRKVRVDLDGGPLHIEWCADNHVLMSGPVAEVFTGELI